MFCKWKDKYHTQIMTCSLVFRQHLAPINIKSLAPGALHPSIGNYLALYVTVVFSLINLGMSWKLWETTTNVVPI